MRTHACCREYRDQDWACGAEERLRSRTVQLASIPGRLINRPGFEANVQLDLGGVFAYVQYKMLIGLLYCASIRTVATSLRLK